jgi:hypothetical protein
MASARRNDRLAEAVDRAGFTQKSFARAVRVAGAEQGVSILCDHTSAGRWLAGTLPRERTAFAILAALRKRLGPQLTLHDIGLAASESVPPDVGRRYEDDVDETLAAVPRLLRADLDDVRTITAGDPAVGAWTQASLAWLTATDTHVPTYTSGVRVGRTDVRVIRQTTDVFVDLDNRFGGGHARRALVQYLSGEVAQLLSGRYSAEVGRELFSTVAESTLLVAWMSYDSGLHGLAQRYFVQALSLAKAGDDRLLGASILSAMSHQATYLERFRDAATLARAARLGIAAACGTLSAQFCAMEARALACLGDATGCDRALSEAVHEFERRHPGADPAWISYFDDAELAAEFGHCFRDLGRATGATTYAAQSLGEANGMYVRSDFFATMVLAHAQLGQREVEEGCRVALRALDLGQQLKSARSAAYLREFRSQLAAVGSPALVQEFEQHAADSPLDRLSA